MFLHVIGEAHALIQISYCYRLSRSCRQQSAEERMIE